MSSSPDVEPFGRWKLIRVRLLDADPLDAAKDLPRCGSSVVYRNRPSWEPRTLALTRTAIRDPDHSGNRWTGTRSRTSRRRPIPPPGGAGFRRPENQRPTSPQAPPALAESAAALHANDRPTSDGDQ